MIPEEIKEYLSYNTESGKLTWIKKPSNQIHANTEAGRVNNNGYVQIGFRGKLYQAHRVVWFIVHGKEPESQLDHINRIKTDNRIENLREVSSRENVQNTSSFKFGVDKLPSGNFRARIYVNGSLKGLGTFKTELEAQEAYQDAVKLLPPTDLA